MRSVSATEIFVEDNYYHVRPSCGAYEMIYRSAKGVYWAPDTKTLYFKGETSKEKAIQIIKEALEEEYGITLEI